MKSNSRSLRAAWTLLPLHRGRRFRWGLTILGLVFLVWSVPESRGQLQTAPSREGAGPVVEEIFEDDFESGGCLAWSISEDCPNFLVVNKEADTDDGSCDPADCSLREAAEAARLTPEDDVIRFSVPLVQLDSGLSWFDDSRARLGGPIRGKLTLDGALGGGNRAVILAESFVIAVGSHEVTLRDLEMRGGSASAVGAGLQFPAEIAASVEIERCSISGFAQHGVRVLGSRVTLFETTVLNNGLSGLFVSLELGAPSSVFVDSSRFAGNGFGGLPADREGGIEASFDSTVLIAGSTFASNRDYGVLAGSNTQVTVTDSTVSGDGSRACLETFQNGILKVVSSTVQDCSVGISMSFSLDPEPILNSTVTRSDVGVRLAGTQDLSVVHSTITGNVVGVEAAGSATLTLKDSISADNSGSDCQASGGSIADGGGNIGDPATCGAGFTALIGSLEPLADSGGPTETVSIEGTNAVDLIAPADCGAKVDQRGIERPQAGLCDAGSVEIEPVPVELLSFSIE
ncbi:MAG: right-handed parallel beta-helix repeat-containing protein [Acidobacteriota bacterium]